MRAKKKYGQHFLVNQSAISTIAQIVNEAADPDGRLVEVGPGKGAISELLVETDHNIKFVEIDPDMIGILIDQLHISEKQIINENILDVNPHEIYAGESFVLFGNYPYNISSQILFWMLSAHEIIPQMLGMFQKEVAQRICADPGSKTYGILSVLVQAIYDVKIVLRLSSGSFSPPPKVDSAVIHCVHRKDLKLDYNQKLFRRIVKTTFNQRRKMISNTIKPLIEDRSILDNEIFTKRPEHLSVQDFIDLTNLLEDYIVN